MWTRGSFASNGRTRFPALETRDFAPPATSSPAPTDAHADNITISSLGRWPDTVRAIPHVQEPLRMYQPTHPPAHVPHTTTQPGQTEEEQGHTLASISLDAAKRPSLNIPEHQFHHILPSYITPQSRAPLPPPQTTTSQLSSNTSTLQPVFYRTLAPRPSRYQDRERALGYTTRREEDLALRSRSTTALSEVNIGDPHTQRDPSHRQQPYHVSRSLPVAIPAPASSLSNRNRTSQWLDGVSAHSAPPLLALGPVRPSSAPPSQADTEVWEYARF
jgi:hypothetical protein